MSKKLLERIIFFLYFMGLPVKWIEVELAKVRCPKCGREVKCFHKISNEASPYEYFVLDCPFCGHNEESSVLATNLYNDPATCPHCGKPYYDHRKFHKETPSRSHRKAT